MCATNKRSEGRSRVTGLEHTEHGTPISAAGDPARRRRGGAEPTDLLAPADIRSCRIERVADKHAYALHSILVRGIQRRHPE